MLVEFLYLLAWLLILLSQGKEQILEPASSRCIGVRYHILQVGKYLTVCNQFS
jgi:hypothetical protein